MYGTHRLLAPRLAPRLDVVFVFALDSAVRKICHRFIPLVRSLGVDENQ